MQTFKEYFESTIPPAMQDWVDSNRQAFIDQYGDEYEAYLLSAAHTIYKRKYRDGTDLK